MLAQRGDIWHQAMRGPTALLARIATSGKSHRCRAHPARGAVDLHDSLRRQLPPLHRLSRDGRRSEAAALRRLCVHTRYHRRVNAAGARGYQCCAPHTCIAGGWGRGRASHPHSQCQRMCSPEAQRNPKALHTVDDTDPALP